MTRRHAIAEASLKSLYLLRDRLLPALRELAAKEPLADGAALAQLLHAHEAEWMNEALPAHDLPPKVRRSNIAAFAADALDICAAEDHGRAERLWQLWFADPVSPFHDSMERTDGPGAAGGGRRLRYRRRTCCLRDAVPGVRRCASCPLSSRAKPMASA